MSEPERSAFEGMSGVTAMTTLPSDSEVLEWIREGWDFARIEAACAQRAGIDPAILGHAAHSFLRLKVALAVGSAMTTGGLGRRYNECVPWRVHDSHQRAYPLRMLRVLGRRRCGEPLSPDQVSELDTFLFLLARARLVIGYCAATEDGFVFLPQEWRTTSDPDLPLCTDPLQPYEVEWVRAHGG